MSVSTVYGPAAVIYYFKFEGLPTVATWLNVMMLLQLCSTPALPILIYSCSPLPIPYSLSLSTTMLSTPFASDLPVQYHILLKTLV